MDPTIPYTPENQGALETFFHQRIGLANLDSTLTGFVTVFSLILGALAILYLLYCGIRYITANGNQDTIKQARSGIVFAVLGIIIVTSAYTIIQVLSGLAALLAR